MKKLILLCLSIAFTLGFSAQETTVKKTTRKAKAKTEKVVNKTEAAVEKGAKKTKTKTKEVAAKAEKTAKKVEAKTEKVAKETGAKIDKTAKKVKPKAEAITEKSDTKAKTTKKTAVKKVKETASNEKAPKVADEVTGEYNGKKVYTGPRGGRYYINSNGNKTYIQE